MQRRTTTERGSQPPPAPPPPPAATVDWDALRFVLAVADAGSLNGGAALLGVRHSTVLRRLNALEAQLGARLFERLRSGWQPTEAGELWVAQARQMRPAIDELLRNVSGRDLQLTGSIRVSTSQIVMRWLLPPVLARFAQAHPAIAVEITENPQQVDLSRRDADVALRMAVDVPQHLVGRALAQIDFRIYAPRGHARLPQRITPLAELLVGPPWIGFEQGSRARFFERWVQDEVAAERIAMRVDRFSAVAGLVASGVGIGLLPRFAGDRDSALVAVSDDISALRTPLWLLTHADLRRSARIRAFMSQVGDGLRDLLAEGGAKPSRGAASSDRG